jgi:hypothetical protein
MAIKPFLPYSIHHSDTAADITARIDNGASAFDTLGMSVSVNGNEVQQRSADQFQEWLDAKPGRRAAYEKSKAAMKAEQQKPAAQRSSKRSYRDMEWDGSSDCFVSLEYSHADGGVWAEFIGPAAGVWFYEMSRAEAKDWFADASVGGYFNDEIR